MDSTAIIVQCIQAAARDLGLAIPNNKAAAHLIGLGLMKARQVVLPGLDASQYPRVVERYHHHYLAQDLTLFEGVCDMLTDLSQQDYFLAIATGKSRLGLNRALLETKLLSVFDAAHCADKTFSKPHPALLQELTSELEQDLKRTMMVVDMTHDLQMDPNAGTAGIAAQYGAYPAHTLQALNSLFSATSIAQLHAWLNDHA